MKKNGGFELVYVLIASLALAVGAGIAWVHFYYLPKNASQQNGITATTYPNPPSSTNLRSSHAYHSNFIDKPILIAGHFRAPNKYLHIYLACDEYGNEFRGQSYGWHRRPKYR